MPSRPTRPRSITFTRRARRARAASAAICRRPRTWSSIRAGLRDADPLVRRAAVHALAEVDPRGRVPLLAPLLEDAVRAVRIEAAAALAGVPPASLPAADGTALNSATAELVAAQQLNA